MVRYGIHTSEVLAVDINVADEASSLINLLNINLDLRYGWFGMIGKVKIATK